MGRADRPEPTAEQLALKVGDLVTVTRDRGELHEGTVKYAPWQLSNGYWLIGVEGISGGYDLTRVQLKQSFSSMLDTTIEGIASLITDEEAQDFARKVNVLERVPVVVEEYGRAFNVTGADLQGAKDGLFMICTPDVNGYRGAVLLDGVGIDVLLIFTEKHHGLGFGTREELLNKLVEELRNLSGWDFAGAILTWMERETKRAGDGG